MTMVCDLSKGKCKPCEGGVPPLSDTEAAAMLATLPGWQREGSVIRKTD
jgi:4a-hydroxytetrahydrobiopterin dehydratase